MNEQSNSLALYWKQKKDLSKSAFFRAEPGPREVTELLKLMKEELIVSGYSPFVAFAYHTCRRFCLKRNLPWREFQPDNYSVKEPFSGCDMPSFDACWLLMCLSEFISSRSLRNVFSDNMTHLYGNTELHRLDAGMLRGALADIDTAIVTQRKQLYGAALKDSEESVTERAEKEIVAWKAQRMQETEQEKDRTLTDAAQQAEREKQAVLLDAEKQAETIVNGAREQADSVISAAERAASARLAEAEKRITDAASKERTEAHEEESRKISARFSEVRSALFQTNEMMKKLEDAFSESMTRKVYSQLIDLYNLIADTKDSAFETAGRNKDTDLENAAYNMDVFLDMITEYLADYGIRTVFSRQGDPFSARVHAVCGSDTQYDPRNAVISKSIRNGFVWGEQVLQKERVEIMREET